MNDLISIIVPAYNNESYLAQCLDSILKQSYQNLEIIVVDDGSTDQTGEIGDNYVKCHPEKIRCIHQSNSGVTNARLAGTELAKGEWIGYVDGDDEIEPDMYERLISNAIKYGADISHCGYQTIVNDGERIHYFYNSGCILQQDRIAGIRDLLSGEQIEPGLWNKLFRRELFDDLLRKDLMDRSLKHNEDLMMNYILFSSAKSSIYEDFCPYHYMARNASATRSPYNIHKAMDPVKVRKWILTHAESEYEELAWKDYLNVCARTYSGMVVRPEYGTEADGLRTELLNNRKKWKVLNKKEQIRTWMVCFFPHLYNRVHRFYVKYFGKVIYE